MKSSPGDDVIEKRVIIDIHTDNKEHKDAYQRNNRMRKRSKHNFSFGNNAKTDDVPEDPEAICYNSRDSDFERYKRKKKEDKDYQFKKKGRNIFDSDKGEDNEEANDYYDIKTFNEENQMIEFEEKKRKNYKKYARTVDDEEEKKLDFSSNFDGSYVRPESDSSSDRSNTEDRIKAYDPSINTESAKESYKKRYIIDKLTDNAEGEESSAKISSKQKNHQRNKSSLIDNNFLDSYNRDGSIDDKDKHIMISEKYSIEVDRTDSKITPPKSKEESLDTTSQKFIDSKMKGKNMIDIISKRKFSKEKIQYSKGSEGTPTSDLRIQDKFLHKENNNRGSCENNNMDLDSVRSIKDNIRASEPSKEDMSNIFSEHRNSLDQRKIGLSTTLDVASLYKLRRIFGSEQIIREYKTSESHLQDHGVNYNSNSKPKSEDYESHIKREVLREDLLLDYDVDNYDYIANDVPINLIYSPKEETKNGKSEEFMATSELIDLFTSEGAHKHLISFDHVDEKEHTQTLFDKNPFKDFTTNKIKQILDNKDFYEVQNLRKSVVNYRASIEKKLLVKLHGKDSPTNIKTRERDIEKWVDKELKDMYEDTEEDKVKQKAFKIIWDTNIQTERIFDLIQKMTNSEAQTPSQRNLNFERNTINDLLRTDSDDRSPDDIGLEQYLKSNPMQTDNKSYSDLISTPNLADEFDKTDDIDNLESTQELINCNFDKIIEKRCGVVISDKDDSSEHNPDRISDSIVTFKPKAIPDTPEEIDFISNSHNSDEDEIIATEVKLDNSSYNGSPEKSPKSDISDKDKVSVAESILSTLVREVQERMFPVRILPQASPASNLDSKYSEKAVFHLKPIPENLKPDIQDIDDTDPSMDEIEDEIMMNFNIIRNFEMRRSRAEKNHYDSRMFTEYVNEVFDAIKSRSDLFLKAFSKPIQKDYLECLSKLHYHGMIEQVPEELDNSLINELDDQASILTIDLYLSLEKKREEENDRIRKLDTDDIPETKMPVALLRGNRTDVDKAHIKNKLSLFAEWEHIHNKVVFDWINEALDIFRPHGKKGEPLPWTGKGAFIVDYTKTEIDAENILDLVMNTLLDWNSFKVGPLPWREFYFNNQFDEDKFADFREKKLAAILAYDVEKEDHEKWLDYEAEESQTKLDLADVVLDKLIEEAVNIFNDISNLRPSSNIL